jgi:hypothetical protein
VTGVRRRSRTIGFFVIQVINHLGVAHGGGARDHWSRAWRAGQVVGTYPNGERMVTRKGWVELVIPVLASMRRGPVWVQVLMEASADTSQSRVRVELRLCLPDYALPGLGSSRAEGSGSIPWVGLGCEGSSPAFLSQLQYTGLLLGLGQRGPEQGRVRPLPCPQDL